MRHDGSFTGIADGYKIVNCNLDQFNDKCNEIVHFILKRCNLEENLCSFEKV